MCLLEILSSYFAFLFLGLLRSMVKFPESQISNDHQESVQVPKGAHKEHVTNVPELQTARGTIFLFFFELLFSFIESEIDTYGSFV